MKCLVIDDEDFSRDFVVTLLSEFGECEEAAGGTEAIGKFTAALENNQPFDLIILDIMMAEMNGHETAKALRIIEKEHSVEINKKAKIVMLTALNSPEDAMESFFSAQSAAYIIKPVSREKLVEVISKLGLRK